MANTNWQDPGSSVIRSPHIKGLQDAIGKIETILDIENVAVTGLALGVVTTPTMYTVYQAASGSGNWVSSPTPVVKKNGSVVSSGFTIDYGAGAVVFSTPLIVTDVVTADVTRTTTSATNIDTPEYVAEATVTQEITSLGSSIIEGGFNSCVLKGNTHVNFVKNGNFVGTTNWAGVVSTLSATSNTLSVTGNGAGATPYTAQTTSLQYSNGKKIYIKILVRSTNSVCLYFLLALRTTGMSEVGVNVQYSPIQNTWYLLSGVATLTAGGSVGGIMQLDIRHSYVDAATANGKVMEVKEVLAIDLTTEYGAGNEPSASQCDEIYKNWFDGVKSTDRNVVKCVGKNLFDKPNSIYSFPIITVDGYTCFSVPHAVREFYRIPFKPNTQYKLKAEYKSLTGTAGYLEFVYTDGSNGSAIGGNSTSWTSTIGGVSSAGKTVAYVRTTYGSGGTSVFRNIQLEENTVDTTYEAYKETYQEIPVALKSVSSTVKDTFDCKTGLHTINCSHDTDISSTQYDSLDKTTYTNVDIIKTTAFSSAIAGTTGIDGNTKYVDKNNVQLVEVSQANIDLTASIGKYYYHTDETIWIIVAPDTYVDIAAARTGLGTSQLVYQLNYPSLGYYPTSVLQAYKSGSIYVVPEIKETQKYATEITVENSSYPITQLLEVYKQDDVTGLLTPVPISSCTVASGGLTFTISGASAGEYYTYKYRHADLSTVGSLTYQYNNSLKAQVNSNTTTIVQLQNQINDLRSILEEIRERLVVEETP